MSQFREESAAEGEQHSGEAGLKETHPVCRPSPPGSERPECGILRTQLHSPPGLCAEVARCEVGACLT